MTRAPAPPLPDALHAKTERMRASSWRSRGDFVVWFASVNDDGALNDPVTGSSDAPSSPAAVTAEVHAAARSPR